jgi:enoyl-CoA hydratase/carnithine racemase
MAYDYKLLKVDTVGRVATVTVNNPPINLITRELYRELAALAGELENDEALTVVVLRSADPEFFLAHFDVSTILKFPTDRARRAGYAVIEISVGNLRFNAEARGEPNAPLVLMLHGFPQTGYAWRKQLDPLARAGYFAWWHWNPASAPPGRSSSGNGDYPGW